MDTTKSINEVLFLVTYKCNLNCSYCFSLPEWFERKEEISISGYKKILKEISKYNIPKLISISGGEPFIRNDILEIIDLILDKTESELHINTNGLLVENNHISYFSSLSDMLRKRLKFSVSLDAPNEILSEMHKGKNIYSNVVELIKELKAQKFKVGINIVCLKQNIDIILNFVNGLVNEFKDIKISLFRFIPMGLGSINLQDHWITDEQVKNLIVELNKNKMPNLNLNKLELNEFCSAKDRITIDPQGFVKSCISCFWEDKLRVPFFDLKSDSILRTWETAVLEAKKKFHLISKPYKIPSSCAVFNYLRTINNNFMQES